MGFGSYCHVFSPTNLKKIRFRFHREKNKKTSLSKVKSLNGRNFINNKWKKFDKKSLFPYPLWIIKKKFWPIFPVLAQIFLVQNWPNFFFVMQSGYGEQIFFVKSFYLLLKKFRPFSDFTFESEFLWFFSQGLRNRQERRS